MTGPEDVGRATVPGPAVSTGSERLAVSLVALAPGRALLGLVFHTRYASRPLGMATVPRYAPFRRISDLCLCSNLVLPKWADSTSPEALHALISEGRDVSFGTSMACWSNSRRNPSFLVTRPAYDMEPSTNPTRLASVACHSLPPGTQIAHPWHRRAWSRPRDSAIAGRPEAHHGSARPDVVGTAVETAGLVRIPLLC
jgi:hypothetical protein